MAKLGPITCKFCLLHDQFSRIILSNTILIISSRIAERMSVNYLVTFAPFVIVIAEYIIHAIKLALLCGSQIVGRSQDSNAVKTQHCD